jgi:hypothetical protein
MREKRAAVVFVSLLSIPACFYCDDDDACEDTSETREDAGSNVIQNSTESPENGEEACEYEKAFDNSTQGSECVDTCTSLDETKVLACPSLRMEGEIVAGGLPGATDPYAGVMAKNLCTNDQAVTYAGVDGSFGLALPGELGDIIGVLVGDHGYLDQRTKVVVMKCK